MFFTLLIAYLGGEDCLIDYLELKSHMAHPGSLRRCCSRITLGRKFLRRIKQGTLQFVLVRPTTALLALVLSMFGLYDEENWGLDSGYIYLTFINNVSVTVSLYVNFSNSPQEQLPSYLTQICTDRYSLVLFYKATELRLSSFRPLPKFLSIKAIVFFSYWQGLILSVLVHEGFISDDNPAPQHSEGAAAALKRSMGLSATTKATQAQDMLICIEIVFAALALSSAFSYQDFTDDDRARRPLMASLAEVLDPQDLAHDAHSTFILPQGQQSLGPRNVEMQTKKGRGMRNGKNNRRYDAHVREY
jgi:hypothetical protein